MQENLLELSAALVTPKQAAKFLACSASWLALMRMRGEGPAYVRHGRFVRYRRGDLERWTAEHRVAGGAPLEAA